RSAVNEAVRREGLTNAIVWIVPRTTVSDARDLTQNYPLDYYPSDAILVLDTGSDTRACVSSLFPGRRQYWIARGEADDVNLVSGQVDPQTGMVSLPGGSDDAEGDLGVGDATESSTSSWTPRAVGSSLAFWFDPTSMTVDHGRVRRWRDLSGNGNDA